MWEDGPVLRGDMGKALTIDGFLRCGDETVGSEDELGGGEVMWGVLSSSLVSIALPSSVVFPYTHGGIFISLFSF